VTRAAVASDAVERSVSCAIDEAKALAAKGRHGAALAKLNEAIVSFPEDPELLISRAGVLLTWGRTKEAIEDYLHAASQGVQHPELMSALGWLHLQGGRLPEAESWMRRCVAAEPGAIAASHGLSRTLMAQQKIDEAASLCEEVLKQVPDDVESLALLAEGKLRQNDLVAAEACLRRALRIAPANAALWINLSACLRNQHRITEAMQALDEAQRVAIDADDDSFVNIAAGRRILDQLDDALTVCEQNLAQRPNVDGHRVYAYALLCAGRLVEGWDHNEFRWLREPLLSLRRAAHGVPWRGQDLSGKSIVLHVEQGFGDAIQFVRYARHVKALGASVTLAVFPELERLVSTCAGIDRIVNRNEPLPRGDHYCHLLSLPRIFGTALGSIPDDVPYLHADSNEAAHWRTRLAAPGYLRVGLVWAGNPKQARDRDRSIALQLLAPLLAMPGVKFFSLQIAPAARQLDDLPLALRPSDLAPHLRDFADTAAVVSQLDLVITVDTAIAHLAGALGKPVWVLLHKDPDWRYMEKRQDSPWYPTMRLFRQQDDGDWMRVIEQVRVALSEQLKARVGSAIATIDTSRCVTLAPKPTLARLSAGHRPGFSAIAETRYGIVQYFPDEPVVGDSIDWYGEYVQRQLDVLDRILRPGATLIEVASGVGAHALRLAERLGPSGHLYLCEPRPMMQRVLRQNLATNRAGNVTVLTGTLGRAIDGTTDITTETIDALQLPQLLLVKVNVPAQTADVLAGAADTLWRLRPLLFLGAADRPQLDKLSAHTRDYGYRCWTVETPLFNPDNYNRRKENIFAGLNALALLGIPEEVDPTSFVNGFVEL
jgi:tetratricopeptide (TPR) repeat protein